MFRVVSLLKVAYFGNMGTLLPSAKITRLQARLDAKENQLELAEGTLEELLARRVEESTLNTGEGLQKTKLWDIDKLRQTIQILEAEIDWLERKIANSAFVNNMNVRRKF
jgi:hypothetical protein